MKHLILLAIIAIAIIYTNQNVVAQLNVSGNVLNERGETIEYVSIGFNCDSVGTISDDNGHFSLKIPEGRTKTLIFSHVSYLPAEIPFESYSAGNELTIVLKDKTIILPEVTIRKSSKPEVIVGKGMPMIGGCMFTKRDKTDSPEGGPMFTPEKDYIISNILLDIKECTYKECTLSFNLYERQDSKLVNVLQKPIYQTVQQKKKSFTLDVMPEETLVLKQGKEYYLSVAMVDCEGEGVLMSPARVKSGYYRKSIIDGEPEKKPICLPIVIKGNEL
ncbi:MAG: carboxypeptidase-like regulatory domain-containing protein [Bacteroidales bacterium]|nr:carboxypeptidase-like regulatory domain-containing protein [Bacteroidales bacterium]